MKILLSLALTASLGLALTASADVKETFAKECVKCHGADGKGDTKMGKKAVVKDFTDAKTFEGKTDAALFKSVKEGVKDGDKTRMKAYGEEGLSDDDIKALVAYVRTLKK